MNICEQNYTSNGLWIVAVCVIRMGRGERCRVFSVVSLKSVVLCPMYVVNSVHLCRSGCRQIRSCLTVRSFVSGIMSFSGLVGLMPFSGPSELHGESVVVAVWADVGRMPLSPETHPSCVRWPMTSNVGGSGNVGLVEGRLRWWIGGNGGLGGMSQCVTVSCGVYLCRVGYGGVRPRVGVGLCRGRHDSNPGCGCRT